MGRTWTHAGGIVVRIAAGRAQFLLVSSRRNPSSWVLPKGHVESGETLKKTALREVREESGVVAEVLRSVGGSRYERSGDPIAVRYFAMRPLSVEPAKEGRAVEWCDREVARTRLPWADLHELLDRAAVIVAEDVEKRR